MLNLLSRLEQTSLVLLTPVDIKSTTRFKAIDASCAEHSHRLAQIQSLRTDAAGRWFSNSPTDTRDANSWHLIGINQTCDDVSGAIRIRHFPTGNAPPRPSDILGFSDVAASDNQTEEQLQRALGDYIKKQVAGCGGFYTSGGLVVAPSRRGSVLATILTLAVYAWADVMNLLGGCYFATVETGVEKFYRRFGGFPLALDDQPLPSFHCDRHDALVRLMGIEPNRYEERLAGTVAAIRQAISNPIAAPDPALHGSPR